MKDFFKYNMRFHLDDGEVLLTHFCQKYLPSSQKMCLYFEKKSGHLLPQVLNIFTEKLNLTLLDVDSMSSYSCFAFRDSATNQSIVLQVYCTQDELKNPAKGIDYVIYCHLYADFKYIYDFYKKFVDLELSLYEDQPTITWVTTKKGGFIDKTLKVSKNYNMKDCLYPHLGAKIDEFCSNYEKSNSPILILLGPPGMGKTSFIRNYLYEYNKKALVSYDIALMSTDSFFLHYLDVEQDVLILEDFDQFLKKRSHNEDDKVIHKFLNLSEGIINVGLKKIIFTANLEKEDIDPALIRPGRCFEVLEFFPYTKKQALTIASEYDINLDSDLANQTDGVSLAEIFNNKKKIEQSQGKVGF